MNNAFIPSSILGERERILFHSPALPASGIILAHHACGLASLLADALLVGFKKHALVGFPEVAEGAAATVRLEYQPKTTSTWSRPQVAFDVSTICRV